MKVHYYKDTDSLYIDLSEKKSTDSKEVAPGVVLDFDSKGQLTGIDIDHASKNANISHLEAIALPLCHSIVREKPAKYSPKKKTAHKR
jgi:uncharacterized protein YuzE